MDVCRGWKNIKIYKILEFNSFMVRHVFLYRANNGKLAYCTTDEIARCDKPENLESDLEAFIRRGYELAPCITPDGKVKPVPDSVLKILEINSRG